jgi:arylsulfatase A-like enzyme
VHQDLIQKHFDFYGDDNEPLRTFFSELPKNKPFFLWFGSRDPHRPYGPGAFTPAHRLEDVTVPQFLPDTLKVRQDQAYYYDEIARFDKECGVILSLLEESGLSGNTMVVMSGDNGMPFPRAKGTLYEPGVNVPLIIKWPGIIKEGTVSNELISLMDLPATWLDIAGITIPKEFEGISLKLYFRNEMKYIPRDYVFFERNWHDNWLPLRGCVTNKYKMIINYRPEIPYLPSLDLYESDSFIEIMRLGNAGELQGNLNWYLNTTTPILELYDIENDSGEWHNLANGPNNEGIREKLLE